MTFSSLSSSALKFTFHWEMVILNTLPIASSILAFVEAPPAGIQRNREIKFEEAGRPDKRENMYLVILFITLSMSGIPGGWKCPNPSLNTSCDAPITARNDQNHLCHTETFRSLFKPDLLYTSISYEYHMVIWSIFFFGKKLPDIVLRISGDRSHMT